MTQKRGSGHLVPQQKAPRRGAFSIGAPRFELGTSPTRTVRATRLRHAPKSPQYHTRPATRRPLWSGPGAKVGRCPPHRRADRRGRPPARAGSLRGLLRQRPAGPGGADSVEHDRERRLGPRRAVRAGGRGAGRAAARPPRPVLGLRRAARSTRRSSAACRSCSTPASPWPPTTCRSTPTPSSATTPCSRERWARSSSSRSPHHRGASRSASSRRSPRRRPRASELVASLR